MDFFTINLLTSEEEYSHYFSTLLMSSKISIWSIKSASVIRSSWWPCLDRENFKVVLQFPPSTAVRCLSYNRRKIKSKTCISVKKWFFSKKRSFPRLLTFWWNCFNWLPQCKAKNYHFHKFSFCVMHNEEELWKLAGISMFGLMEKSHSSQSNSHK